MKMIMHHQKIRVDQRKENILIGEDARPYVDPNGKILVVADGLGGRGGYPHSKILLEDETLNENNVYDVIFGEVFADLDSQPDEDFKDYVAKSFYEILNPPSFYIDKKRAVRTSGYYASRLVSIITIALIKYTENFNADALFEKIDNAIADKQNIIDEYCDNLANVLREKVSAAAQSVGLECESSLKGAYLLPSTLTVALVREKEDGLDVVYLWAGDSRGYIWTEKGGLMQITDDHEKYETMTNLITLTKDFKIEGALLSNIEKPCLLFNASDGCYKCMCYASPFDLECTIIDALSQVDNFEELSASLKNIFDIIGKHDDSNTMALYSYGFADFNAIKTAVQNRIDGLEKTVEKTVKAFNKKEKSCVEITLNDIKTKDYSGKKQEAEDAVVNALIDNANVLNVSQVKDVIIEKMLECKYSPFVSAVKETYLSLSSEVKAFVNPDDLSIEELAKLYLGETGRQCELNNKNKSNKLYKLIEKNMNDGVVFSNFKINIPKEINCLDKNEDQKFVFAIFFAILQRKIIMDGNNFVYGDQINSIPEEYFQDFKDTIEFLLENLLKCQFIKNLKDVTKKHVGEFYGSKECKRNIRKIYEELCDAKLDKKIAEIDEDFKSKLDALKAAQNDFDARAKFYEEYDEGYTARYVESKLIKE